jgi:hypothetical protein
VLYGGDGLGMVCGYDWLGIVSCCDRLGVVDTEITAASTSIEVLLH